MNRYELHQALLEARKEIAALKQQQQSSPARRGLNLDLGPWEMPQISYIEQPGKAKVFVDLYQSQGHDAYELRLMTRLNGEKHWVRTLLGRQELERFVRPDHMESYLTRLVQRAKRDFADYLLSQYEFVEDDRNPLPRWLGSSIMQTVLEVLRRKEGNQP